MVENFSCLFQPLFHKMTPTNNLDLEGNFLAFPLAELLTEIGEVRLSGSLRLSHEQQKLIVYLQKGEIVYAVSNSRSSRLFDILLRENKIDKKTLTEIPNFTNDLELAKALIERNLFEKVKLDALFSRQIEGILQEAIRWKSGEWIFSPLARIRKGIRFETNLPKLLAEYARELSGEKIFQRFRSVKEIFTPKPMSEATINLQPHEAFVLSRFADSELTIEEIKTLSGLPEAATFQTLYALWLGGFLTRKNWNAAFNQRKVAEIHSANLILKQSSTVEISSSETRIKTPKPLETKIEETETNAEKKITLEEYLTQTENAAHHYETLGVELKAAPDEIKKSYFAFAKRFHPDLFQRHTAPELFRQVQNSFTKIAQAYETLRDKDLREVYDYRLRKELIQMEERQTSGKITEKTGAEGKKALAAEQFEQGYSILMDEYYTEAAPFLARAVHLAPDNAHYHAFYGKALSFDEKQRHKAESEIQTAIRLDPNNEIYRIISAEFFVHYSLPKRAEGELKRLLAIAPNNREAQTLLDSLQNK